jgi:hypothetical protein
MKKDINNAVYNYVIEISNKIKCKDHKEDVVQDVMIVLIGKGLHKANLDEGLKNYIKGIVWNVSTTFFNKMNNYAVTFTDSSPGVNYVYVSDNEPETQNTDKLYSLIKAYVFKNYYLPGKSVMRWRVFYLRLKGYDYQYIKTRCGIGYSSALEYYSKSCIELKNKLKIEIE